MTSVYANVIFVMILLKSKMVFSLPMCVYSAMCTRRVFLSFMVNARKLNC